MHRNDDIPGSNEKGCRCRSFRVSWKPQHVSTSWSILVITFKQNQPQLASKRDSSDYRFPFAALMLNSEAWMLYSLFLKDWYLFAPNLAGYAIAMYYTMTTFRYSSAKDQQSTIILVTTVSCLLYFFASITFIATGVGLPLAICCVAVLLVFYSSPLSTLRNVVVERNSVSIDVRLAFAW